MLSDEWQIWAVLLLDPPSFNDPKRWRVDPYSPGEGIRKGPWGLALNEHASARLASSVAGASLTNLNERAKGNRLIVFVEREKTVCVYLDLLVTLAATTTARPIPTTGTSRTGNSGMAAPSVSVTVYRSNGGVPTMLVWFMTAVMLSVTAPVPEAGAVHSTVHWVAVIGVTESFAEAWIAVLISTFGSVVASVPPPTAGDVMRKLKELFPVRPFGSATITSTEYCCPGVYVPLGIPFTVRKGVILYEWHPHPPSLSG